MILSDFVSYLDDVLEAGVLHQDVEDNCYNYYEEEEVEVLQDVSQEVLEDIQDTDHWSCLH